MPLSKPRRRLRSRMLMPTCTSGSSRRSRREPPFASSGCHCGERSCTTKDESEELAIRIKRIRAALIARLELVYEPELSTSV